MARFLIEVHWESRTRAGSAGEGHRAAISLLRQVGRGAGAGASRQGLT